MSEAISVSSSPGDFQDNRRAAKTDGLPDTYRVFWRTHNAHQCHGNPQGEATRNDLHPVRLQFSHCKESPLKLCSRQNGHLLVQQVN